MAKSRDEEDKGKRTPNRDIQKVSGAPGVPDYLQEFVQDDNSMDAMAGYRVVPRLKIIQPTAKQELKQKFNEGDTIISPGQALVAAMTNKKESLGDVFKFVPVLFFTEFCKWSDLKDTASPTIVARTGDESHEIAKKSRDAEAREEVYGDKKQFTYRYVEHLNFVGTIYGEHDLKMQMCVLGFARGEFSNGRGFISGLMMRKIPLWSKVIELRTGFRDKGPDRKWWGFNANITGETITQDEVPVFKELHDNLAKEHAERRVVVDHSEGDETPDDAETKASKAKESRF